MNAPPYQPPSPTTDAIASGRPASSVLTPVQQSIIRRIHELRARNEPLNIAAVKRRHPGLVESVYSFQPYWGWRQALRDAGLDYADIRIELLDHCTCQICGESFSSLSTHLPRIHETNGEDYRRDYPGAELVSEVMRRITRKCPALADWEPLWSMEYIRDRAAEFHRRGWALDQTSLQERDPGMYGKVIAQGGSWNGVLRDIGLDPDEIRRIADRRFMSREDVIANLQDRHRSGLPLNAHAIRRDDGPLAEAAYRLFGNLDRAFSTAGLDPNAIRLVPLYDKKTRRKDFEREMRAFAELPREARHAQSPAFHKKWDGWVAKQEGSLRKACARLGLEYAAFDTRNHYGNKAEALEGVHRHFQNAAQHPGVLQPSETLRNAVRRYFGAWSKAAAIVKKTMVPARYVAPPPPPLPIVLSDRQAIIDRIRALHERDEPLNISAVKRRHPGLVESVYSFKPYWGWRQALRDADIDYADICVDLSETCVCRVCGFQAGFLSFHLQDSHSLSAAAYRHAFPGAETTAESKRAATAVRRNRSIIPVWEPIWTWEYLCDRALAYHRQGHTMNPANMRRLDAPMMAYLIRSEIPWTNVLRTIGVGVDATKVGAPMK